MASPFSFSMYLKKFLFSGSLLENTKAIYILEMLRSHFIILFCF
jgi:hypothetical protein